MNDMANNLLYERAESALNAAVGFCFGDLERARGTDGDGALVVGLKEQFTELYRLRDALAGKSDAELQAIVNAYGPAIKARVDRCRSGEGS